MIAKEKGVQPLADLIFAQRRGDDPLALAQAYVSEEKGVPDAETAVQLAQDILAEQISDDAAIRANLRALYRRTGVLRSVAAKEGESVYAQYADYREPVLRAAGHRILAINRGEREEWLKVAVGMRRRAGDADHLPCGDPGRAVPAATWCAQRRRTRGAGSSAVA